MNNHSKLIQVRWRGEVVGTLSEEATDMWHLDGIWTPADNPLSSQFAERAKGLDLKTVFRDPAKGFRIELIMGEIVGHAVVLSLVGDRLSVRRVFDQTAISWLLAHVPE